jgi:type IV pilus assembly protein PilN
MRFTLNLATRTYINTRQVNLVFGVTGGILLVILMVLSFLFMTNISEQQRLEKDLASVEARIKATGKGISDKEYQALLGRIKIANGIIQKKSFNWLGLFNWLEVVVPEGIMITSLEPSLKEGKLTVSGVARNFQMVRKFLENLEDSKFFTDIYLLSENVMKVDESQKGISFSVVCKADMQKL